MWPSAPIVKAIISSSQLQAASVWRRTGTRWFSVHVDILAGIDGLDIKSRLPAILGGRDAVERIHQRHYKFYSETGFAYLEINPFTFSDGDIVPLDMVAKLDDAEEYWQRKRWEGLAFPEPFGRTLSKEEMFIKDLDSKTGASLKLTILNPEGRVWTMVAGGGASVIYADTICDLGFAREMANYGEYSGDPNTEETYHYTKTILDLMTRERSKRERCSSSAGPLPTSPMWPRPSREWSWPWRSTSRSCRKQESRSMCAEAAPTTSRA